MKSPIIIGVDWSHGSDKTVVVLWDGGKIVDTMTWEEYRGSDSSRAQDRRKP